MGGYIRKRLRPGYAGRHLVPLRRLLPVGVSRLYRARPPRLRPWVSPREEVTLCPFSFLPSNRTGVTLNRLGNRSKNLVDSVRPIYAIIAPVALRKNISNTASP